MKNKIAILNLFLFVFLMGSITSYASETDPQYSWPIEIAC